MKYQHCNHHHELTKDYSVVNFGYEEFVANNDAIPLLKALNEIGLQTRTHHIVRGDEGAFISVLLDGVRIEVREVHERNSTRATHNGKTELLILWKPAERIQQETKDVEYSAAFEDWWDGQFGPGGESNNMHYEK